MAYLAVNRDGEELVFITRYGREEDKNVPKKRQVY